MDHPGGLDVAEISGRRCDIDLMPQWERNLKGDKELDYHNQLMLYNTLVVVWQEYVKLCGIARDQAVTIETMQPHMNRMQAILFAWEISGLGEIREVYDVWCRMMSDIEDVNK